ncbi:hypothetical protein M501DRAFT_1000561 [Patellaria atrata CBS 101060]|uniref:AMP-dependent synthetase/ligase domain-containing protein n=1 Tax=Patellaria atrata CBS 101060 TaxID=1346257 RepID=A0A9P4SFD1_9PEZI|nr:hypothetical protein M501DRAFT_1000561 [Patellaria atrata CBS 101060]
MGLLDDIDTHITNLLSGWNSYTILITLAIVSFGGYVIFSAVEPDTHPFLLLRQGQPSPVRQPGESAIYRSQHTPHGYPLQSGLNVKYPGEPRYTNGRTGDLRDIWRRVTGDLPVQDGQDTKTSATPGKILTVFGKEEVVEHNPKELSGDIVAIGSYLQKHGCRRVALYLPNSIEFLSALFAGAFYGFSVILIPYNQPYDLVTDLINQTKADGLVGQAGSVPLEHISESSPGIKQVVWVVEKTSRHMDWSEVPEGTGGRVEVNVWHDLVQDHVQQQGGKIDLPELQENPGTIVSIWQSAQGQPGEIAEFTQNNIVAGIAGVVNSIPVRQRFSRADLFLPADSWTHIYALTVTLAALFAQSSLAINSVAGEGVNLALASRSISPTVIVASAATASELHSDTKESATGTLKKYAHYTQTQALQAGRMPVDSLLSTINAPARAPIGTTPGKLRLLFISEKAGTETVPLSSTELSDLRIYTNARVVYALTAAKVAGAVTQTNLYDYRRESVKGGKHGHFGPPVGSVEVKLRDSGVHKTGEEGDPRGEIVVSGPAVAGGEAGLGVIGTFRDDGCLAYV